MENRGVFSMAAAIVLRPDYIADDLRRLAKASRDAKHRITSYNVCYTKLLRQVFRISEGDVGIIDCERKNLGRQPEKE